MRLKKFAGVLGAGLVWFCAAVLAAPDGSRMAEATNDLAARLYGEIAGGAAGANTCFSPWSIQLAFSMAAAGASGETEAQMREALGYPARAFDAPGAARALAAKLERARGAGPDGFVLSVANRIFVDGGFELVPAFVKTCGRDFGAEPEALGFRTDPGSARERINQWIAEQTRQKILDLIPDGAITAATRTVLANAIYFKAAWLEPFSETATSDGPFATPGGGSIDVPMMRRTGKMGYLRGRGYQAVALPYAGADFAFVVVVPDAADGLPAIERVLSPAFFANLAGMETARVSLSLPRFKIEPPAVNLRDAMESLGMTAAFDPDRAEFSRMDASGELYVSAAFHKAFIEVDEAGTEAAAATAVVMDVRAMRPEAEPVEVKADRPFLYAIQHRPTGVVLFLGRLATPGAE